MEKDIEKKGETQKETAKGPVLQAKGSGKKWAESWDPPRSLVQYVNVRSKRGG